VKLGTRKVRARKVRVSEFRASEVCAAELAPVRFAASRSAPLRSAPLRSAPMGGPKRRGALERCWNVRFEHVPPAATGYALIGASDVFGVFKSTAGRLGIRDPGAAGRLLEDPAVGEGLADGLGGGGAIELLGGCDRPGCQVGHVRAGEVERALQDDCVGLDVAERLADVPQRP
jgi:hypothetical protein